jgi:sugar O-acyltransferase (sialic acid O-acetyltransferase NeuD family)
MPINKFIYGAGGHAKVVLDALLCLGAKVRVLDDDPAKKGYMILDVPVEYAESGKLPPIAHLAVGDNTVRAQLYESIIKEVESWFSVIHPRSSVAESAKLEEGVFVAAQSVIAADSVIQTATIINHGAVIDHDCRVGRFCHVAPNATLGGGAAIGKCVLIGSGAVVLPGIKIGDNCTIGAGSVVTKDLLENSIVTGVPARDAK